MLRIEIYMCDDVQNVDVEAPNVDTFTGTLSYDVKFLSSFALRKLKLIAQSLLGERLQTLISLASNLEYLEIYHWRLKDIQIKSQNLKTLKLLYSRASSVAVEAPNLLSLEYSSFTIPFNVSVLSSKPLNVHMKLWLRLDEPCNLQRVAKLANVVMRSSISKRFKLKLNQDNKLLIHDNINEEFLYSSCDLIDFKQALELSISSMDSVVFADYLIQKLYPKTLSVACYSTKPIKFRYEELVQPKEGCVGCCKSSAILVIYKLIFKLKTIKKMWSRGKSVGDALVFL
ncbi:hypothetical protein LIER_17530 [Lithospermum erythrorhizon]|uniref:Uncharacterized protein n=1 Tax=Lithospermum erythrorhizon TaxID=34254 RepID=A0AAV3QD23_LITER